MPLGWSKRIGVSSGTNSSRGVRALSANRRRTRVANAPRGRAPAGVSTTTRVPPAVKVVAGAETVAALWLYARCGFVPRARIAVHEGTASEVLVWSSS